ncbi:hypothetical protein ABEB36_006130 [Hypothenemus hampei]|uniref:Uncharacterized protein n=1 Tax=Hypothenemus hampei TaxID=57062 RepID=A0ABD1F3Q1_HYPHA
MLCYQVTFAMIMLPIFKYFFKIALLETLSKNENLYSLTKDEFILLYIAMFGYPPLYEEIKAVFKGDDCHQDLHIVEKFLELRFSGTKSLELHVLELFKILDKDNKGYITCRDFIDLECDEYKLPKNFTDYFVSVTRVASILDFFTFKEIYSNVNQHLWSSKH